MSSSPCTHTRTCSFAKVYRFQAHPQHLAGHLPASNITKALCRQHLRGSPCSRPGRVQRGILVIAMAAAGADGKLTVTVTGAGGRTGKLVLKKLLAQPERYTARGLVRDEKSAKRLEAEGVPSGALYCGDILKDSGALERSLEGADALVIATSAVPQIKPMSIAKVFLKKLLRQEGARPEFTFKAGQMPEQVDWQGQKAQIDAAKEAGVKKVVLISSMGVTDESNSLNKLGDGNILVWKRKAEQYLIESGTVNYTIIHPGGLIDDEGGKRELVLGLDDALLKRKSRRIPRADVAELAVQCLALKAADNRSFDCISREPGEGTPTEGAEGFSALLSALEGNCAYPEPKPAAAARRSFSAPAPLPAVTQ